MIPVDFGNADVQVGAGPRSYFHSPGESPAETVQVVDAPTSPPPSPPNPNLKPRLWVNLNSSCVKFELVGFLNDPDVCAEGCRQFTDGMEERLEARFGPIREKVLKGEAFLQLKKIRAEIEKTIKKIEAQYAEANHLEGPQVQKELQEGKDPANTWIRARNARGQAHQSEEWLAKLQQGLLKDAEAKANAELTQALEVALRQEVELAVANRERLFDQLMALAGELVPIIELERVMTRTSSQAIVERFGKLP